MDASHNWPCWSGFSFDRKYFASPVEASTALHRLPPPSYAFHCLLRYFASPESFLGWCKARGVHNGFNLHFQSGLVKAEEDAPHWESFARAMRLPATAEYTAFDPLNETYSAHFHTHVLAPLERQGVDFWWLDWQQVTDNLPAYLPPPHLFWSLISSPPLHSLPSHPLPRGRARRSSQAPMCPKPTRPGGSTTSTAHSPTGGRPRGHYKQRRRQATPREATPHEATSHEATPRVREATRRLLTCRCGGG